MGNLKMVRILNPLKLDKWSDLKNPPFKVVFEYL